MSSTVARYSEADQLRDRIVEAELRHANEVRAWQAESKRLSDLVAALRSRLQVHRDWHVEKHLRGAELELRNLGPEPVEPIRLGLLRGRLAAAEGRAAIHEPQGAVASGEVAANGSGPDAPSPATSGSDRAMAQRFR